MNRDFVKDNFWIFSTFSNNLLSSMYLPSPLLHMALVCISVVSRFDFFYEIKQRLYGLVWKLSNEFKQRL